MHNLPLDGLLLACLFFAIFIARKEARVFFKDLVSVGDDRWTWTTRTGDLYEDVEIEKIEAEELVLKHKFGVSRLAINALSEKSRQLLLRTSQWRHHASSAPAYGKITPFAAEPVHEAHAAHATQAA
jgi:hypothetical protein